MKTSKYVQEQKSHKVGCTPTISENDAKAMQQEGQSFPHVEHQGVHRQIWDTDTSPTQTRGLNGTLKLRTSRRKRKRQSCSLDFRQKFLRYDDTKNTIHKGTRIQTSLSNCKMFVLNRETVRSVEDKLETAETRKSHLTEGSSNVCKKTSNSSSRLKTSTQ